MPAGRFRLDVHCGQIEDVVRALRQEEDGRELRKELARNMRAALRPAAEDAKQGIRSMPSSGTSTSSPALRSTIARKIRTEVRLSGRSTGARVKARKTPDLRGFANAPKRTQRAGGWRTQNFGNGTWRTQTGKPNWFDDAVAEHFQEYRRAAQEALADMARRIARRVG